MLVYLPECVAVVIVVLLQKWAGMGIEVKLPALAVVVIVVNLPHWVTVVMVVKLTD